MDAIRLINLRSLTDTGFVSLKPITILVGQNNSGKSTFLRFLPLLRQSVEARTKGPILWYGRLVDFGSYKEAVHNNQRDEGIAIQLKFTLLGERIAYPGSFRRQPLAGDVGCEVTIRLQEASNDGATYTSFLEVLIADNLITMQFDQYGRVTELKANTTDFSEFIGKDFFSTTRQGIVPVFIESLRHEFYEATTNLGVEVIRGVVHGRTSGETVSRLLSRLQVGSSERMLALMQRLPDAPGTWTEHVSHWQLDTPEFLQLRNILIALSLPYLLSICDDAVTAFAHNIRYIAPVRAAAERYSRIQNLAVDEVDFQGANLTMFLRNLSETQSRKFQEWTKRLFGFATIADSSGPGHISLRVVEVGSQDPVNIADKGFGYSQVLPILTQLWHLTTERSRSQRYRGTPMILAIEQPELHLHPQMQGQLLDAFVDTLQQRITGGPDLRLILETHSDTMVNRLGQHVAEGHIRPEDISIVIFEKAGPSEPTKLRIGEYDSEGRLVNWPYGFFDAQWDR